MLMKWSHTFIAFLIVTILIREHTHHIMTPATKNFYYYLKCIFYLVITIIAYLELSKTHSHISHAKEYYHDSHP